MKTRDIFSRKKEKKRKGVTFSWAATPNHVGGPTPATKVAPPSVTSRGCARPPPLARVGLATPKWLQPVATPFFFFFFFFFLRVKSVSKLPKSERDLKLVPYFLKIKIDSLTFSRI
jgi:hypothetical protein